MGHGLSQPHHRDERQPLVPHQNKSSDGVTTMNTSLDLDTWLQAQPTGLRAVLACVAQACTRIGDVASHGALAGVYGVAGSENSQGESQKKLDLAADEAMEQALAACRHVAGWASEEHADPVVSADHAEAGEYLVVYDPLDGSSNIEANISVGTIFSVLPHPFRGTPPGDAGFMQPASQQVAAGYVLYGPSTVMVLTCRNGVHAFTLDRREQRWLLTQEGISVPPTTREFAINASNQRFWEKPVQRYVAECLAGETGPRRHDFNMRWVASMVAEVHRILTRGGVFLYPRDTKEPRKPGRLRLMYEAAPMALIMREAGACAVTGTHDLLDIVPDTLHQRIPVILGSRDEVDRIVAYHEDPHENVSWQLFKTRSLFVQPQA